MALQAPVMNEVRVGVLVEPGEDKQSCLGKMPSNIAENLVVALVDLEYWVIPCIDVPGGVLVLTLV